MKFYLAGRFKQKDLIKKYYLILESYGHTITSKWTEQDCIKLFRENKSKAQQYILEDFSGIKNADIFILFAEYEPDARGCYIELGYALSNAENSNLKIFVVSKDDNPSMFFMDKKVELVNTFDQVLNKLKEEF